MASVASAQLKIGYILSERIRTEYEEFKEAESQLQLEYRKVQFEFDQMGLKMDSLRQDYEVKRLMALDKGESIRQEIEQMEKQIQNFQAEKIKSRFLSQDLSPVVNKERNNDLEALKALYEFLAQ